MKDLRSAAYRYVTIEKHSMREAQAKFGLSKSAVGRMVKGRVSPAKLVGRPTALPAHIEASLSSALLRLCHNACSLPLSRLPIIVKTICEDAGLATPGFVAGRKWTEGFFARHPVLNARLMKGQSKARLTNFNRITVAEWYAHVGPLIARYAPEEILNMDDTGMDMENIKLMVRLIALALLHPHLAFSSVHLSCLFLLHMQVIGERGADRPKRETIVKEGHCALTFTLPARGRPFPSLWTFPGSSKIENYDMGADSDGAQWQRTENGWPDKETMRAWGKMVVDEMKVRDLKKLLIFVDNAEIHCDTELAALFRHNNITLCGLIPSATGFQQPCDKYFPLLKAKIPTVAVHYKRVQSIKTIAGIVARAMSEIEAGAIKAGRSVGAPMFSACGIYPFNPDIFTDADLAPSDARLGLSAASPEVAAAREIGRAAADGIVARVLATHDPDGQAGLDAAAAKAKAARVAAAGTGKSASFEARFVYTSDAFHEIKAAKAAAETAEEERLAEGRKQRAANKIANDAKKAGIAERRAEKEALKAEKEAAAAAAAAAPPQMVSLAAAVKRKRAAPGDDAVDGPARAKKVRAPSSDPQINVYAKSYVVKKTSSNVLM